MRKFQELVAIVGLVAMGSFGLQAASGATPVTSLSATSGYGAVVSAHTGFVDSSKTSPHDVSTSSSDRSAASAVSTSSTSDDLALGGAGAIAAMVALLALGAFGFIVLTFARRRVSTARS